MTSQVGFKSEVGKRQGSMIEVSAKRKTRVPPSEMKEAPSTAIQP